MLVGLNDFKADLRKIAKSIDDSELEERMLEAAKVIRDSAKNKAPLGPTGNLKRGIQAKTFSKKIPGEPASFCAINYKIAPHAHLIEFGTVKQSARPFMRPAIDENISKIVGIIERGVRNKFK